jgi:hypothetical protein
MNERIRELAGQAGFETEHHKWIFANDNAGEGECHELLEKFAELIVRECVAIVADAVDRREPASTYVGKIKEHFEVRNSKREQFDRAIKEVFKDGADLSGKETP